MTGSSKLFSEVSPWELGAAEFREFLRGWQYDCGRQNALALKNASTLRRGFYQADGQAAAGITGELSLQKYLADRNKDWLSMIGPARPGLTIRDRMVFKAADEGYPLPEHVLRDYPGLGDSLSAASWRNPQGELVLPQFKVEDTKEKSARHTAGDSWSVRAFRRGEWIDAVSYTANRRDGLGKRFHTAEWPTTPADQLALIKGLHKPEEMAADRYFEAIARAVTEIAPINQTGFDHPEDWHVTRMYFPSAMIARYAPRTAEANNLLEQGQAVFSLGKEDWAKTYDEFFADFRFEDFSDDEIQDMLVFAESLKPKAKQKWATQLIRDETNPQDFALIEVHPKTRWSEGYSQPVLIQRNDRLYVPDESASDSVVRKFVCENTEQLKRVTLSSSVHDTVLLAHSLQITAALKKSLPVPELVLSDYPELRGHRRSNLAGDDRPVPQFPDESAFTPILAHPEFEEYENQLREEYEEHLHNSFQGYELFEQAQQKCLKAYPGEFEIELEKMYELAREQDWFDALEQEVLAEYGVSSRDDLEEKTDYSLEDFENDLDERAIERLRTEARERLDPSDAIWVFGEDDSSWQDAVHETYFEDCYEVIMQEISADLDGVDYIESYDPESDSDAPLADRYFIMRSKDGDLFHLHGEAAYHDGPGEFLCSAETLSVVKQKAELHARLGFVPHEYPVNPSARPDQWGPARIQVGDGDSSSYFHNYRAIGKGDFGIVAPREAARQAFQAVHLPTGLPVGPLWVDLAQAKSFVDILQPLHDWAKVDFDNLSATSEIAKRATDEARHAVRDAARVGRKVARTRPSVQKVPSQFTKSQSAPVTGFGGAIAFSIGPTEEPRIEPRRSVHKPEISMADIEIGDQICSKQGNRVMLTGTVREKFRTQVEVQTSYMNKPLVRKGRLDHGGAIQVLKPDGTFMSTSAEDVLKMSGVILDKQSTAAPQNTLAHADKTFSVGLLENGLPSFDPQRDEPLERDQVDRRWLMNRIREGAADGGPIFERFIDEHFENYVPDTTSLANYAAATVFNWHGASAEEQSEILESLSNTSEAKLECILIDLADEFETAIQEAYAAELEEYASARVIHDTDGLGYRLVFNGDDPESGIEAYAPGPLGDETFLGYAQGEDFPESFEEAKHIVGRYALMGVRDMDHPSMYQRLNPEAPEDRWTNMTVILSPHLKGPSRLARGFGRGNFGLVKTDRHLGEKQPGFAVIHLPTGLPVKPFFRTDQEARNFAELLEVQADWGALDNGQLLSEQFARLQDIADNSQMAVKDHARSQRPKKPAIRKEDGGFSGAIAFKTGPRRLDALEREIIKEIETSDESKSFRDNWRNFLTLLACELQSYAFAKDSPHWVENERKYLAVVDRYRDSAKGLETVRKNFVRAAQLLQEACAYPESDTLGRIHMQFASEGSFGQYFTPYSVARMMAAMNMGELTPENISQANDGLGFVTLGDMASGAGVMAIAAIDQFREQGLDPTTALRVYLQDLDPRAAEMAFINMALRGVPARVAVGNSLAGEENHVWVTPAFVRERMVDIEKNRKSVLAGEQADFPLMSLSIGNRDYTDLSHKLSRLTGGDASFANPDRKPAPYNDDRLANGQHVPGEAARLASARKMLEAANIGFAEAEAIGLGSPHPERDSMPVSQLGDDYHVELASQIDAFLSTEEFMHPRVHQRAQGLFAAVADYDAARDTYEGRFGSWDSYEELVAPRFKLADQPEFGDEDRLELPSHLEPTREEVNSTASSLTDVYYHSIRSEFLAEHGADFIITDEDLRDRAHGLKTDARAALAAEGREVTEQTIADRAERMAQQSYWREGLAVGDVDEAAFDREWDDQVSEAVFEKAQEVAEETLKARLPRSATDLADLGYTILNVPGDPVYQLHYHGEHFANADRWEEAVLMAQGHARGEDIAALKNPSVPLNANGPTDRFVHRAHVYYSARGRDPEHFNGIGGTLVDPQVYGHFAIARDLNGRPGWYITHLPSGMRIMMGKSRFAREQEARDCVIELEEAGGWDICRDQLADFAKSDERERLRVIAAELIDRHLERSIEGYNQARKQAAGPKSEPAIANIAFSTGVQNWTPAEEKAVVTAFIQAIEEGQSFGHPNELRKIATQTLGKPIAIDGLEAKRVEELAEVAMIRQAEKLIADFDETMPVDQRMGKLAALQAKFPRFGKRTSHSSDMQAYSTPLQLAYFANWMLDAKPGESVGDISAGHGALLIGTAIEDRRANELDPARARFLNVLPSYVTTLDATRPAPGKAKHMLLNPPFGISRTDGGVAERRMLGETGAVPPVPGAKAISTNRMEEMIVWNGLSRLSGGGKAVLIMPHPERSLGDDKAYMARGVRNFYWQLYDKYNVTSHLTLSGDLYRQQGAGWPIDVIVVDGKGPSGLTHPGFSLPPVIETHTQLQEIANHVWKQRSGKLDGKPDLHAAAQLYTKADALDWDSPLAGDDQPAGPRDLSQRTQSETGGTGEEPTREYGAVDQSAANSRSADRSDRAAPQSGFSGMAAADHSGTSNPDGRSNSGSSGQSGSGSDPDGDRRMNQINDATLVPYVPLSGNNSQATLMPANLHTAFEKAKETFLAKNGSIDDFVQEKLGYASRDDLYKALSAEQIDTVGLAIHQHESGGSFINGKLMGMGKGRDAAAMIVYAHRHGMTPIFFTEKPNLYPAIMRDLADIGYGHLRPLVTNDGLTGAKALPLPDGNVLSTPDKAKHDRELIKLRDQRSLGEDYDFVMTTWSQTQTVNGRDTLRRQLLSALAPKAFLVRDESQNAGGQDNLFAPKPGPDNRAEFARTIMYDAKGVYDSSGTHAKRPGVMDLYGRTDLRLAVSNPADIGDVISSHGIPMQQMVATMLAESGQYLRLERSMEGINYEFKSVDIDEKRFDKLAAILEAIAEFDLGKQGALGGRLGKALILEGKASLPDGATGEIAINSTNFTSLLHNVTDQALLAMTADDVADEAIAALKNGEKPFITLANTMGSFLSEYASDHQLQGGEAIAANYGDILKRYVERSRDVTIGTAFGEKERRRLTDNELGARLTKQYDDILKQIDAVDWSAMPASPIDYVRSRIEKAGFTFGEFTGRSDGIDYSEETPRYYRRTAQERSKAAAVETERGFNDGSIDAVLANESAASGISLHASEKFADQRPRVDLTWQAHREINTHVQLKGRVNREGQVHKPRYVHFVPNIPAAERPAAVLEAKLQSLNANTTANKDGLLKSGGENILNAIGDRAAATVMENNPAIHYRFGNPLKPASGGRGYDPEGAARKITGRLVMLPVAEQRRLYKELSKEYKAEYERAKAFGTLKEEATVLDLDARLIGRAKLEGSIKSTSAFGGPVFVNQMNVANLDRPFPWARVQAMLNESFGLDEKSPLQVLQAQGRDHAKALGERMIERFEKYRTAAVEKATGKRKEQTAARLDGDRERFERMINNFPIGRTVAMQDPEGRLIYGIVSGLKKRGSANNPVSPAAWSVQLYLADGSKSIDLRLNEVALPGEKALKGLYQLAKAEQASILVDGEMKTVPIPEAFDKLSSNEREERLIATGNILAAAERFPNARATYYRSNDGEIVAGLLLDRGESLEQTLATAPVPLVTRTHIEKFLEGGYEVYSADNNLVLSKTSRNKEEHVALRAARGRSTGGRYWLDRDIRALTGDFISSGTSMVAFLPVAKLPDLLDLMDAKGTKFIARSDLKEARALTGAILPEMEKAKTARAVSTNPTKQLDAEKSAGFVMPWDLRDTPAEPFARAMQFSLGRPVALRETESGFEPVRHNGAPGPQDDGSRIHRILDVPDYISSDDLIERLHLQDARYVHGFQAVYYSTGQGGLQVFSNDEIGNFPPHHQYDSWAMRRGPAPDGWTAEDVPLLSPSGPVRYPGFTHEDTPGLAVVPFPRPGLQPGTFDSDALRFVVIHKESGQALLPGNRFMYSAEGAAAAARNMAAQYNFKHLSDPEEMSFDDRSKINSLIGKAYEDAREVDREHWIGINLTTGVSEEFKDSETLWMAVLDATSPDLDEMVESYQGMGVFYLYADRDTALDAGMEDAIPVRVIGGKVADLTANPWSEEIRAITREFFEMNQAGLHIGLSSTYYEEADQYEEFDRRVENGEDPETVRDEIVETLVERFDYDAFEDAIRRQDYRMAGDYEGDLKDALMGWLANGGFDSAQMWNPWDYDKRELSVFRVRNIEPAWDQLESSIALAREERREQNARREAWSSDRGEDEVTRLKDWKADQLEGFDTVELQEQGFNINDVHWLAVPNKEYPELDRAWEGARPELFTRRTDAESEGRFAEAVPVYLRRGAGVDLTEDSEKSQDFIAQLRAIPGINLDPVNQLPGGDAGGLIDYIDQLADTRGLDWVQFNQDGITRTRLLDTTDVRVAWDAIQRKSLHRRTSDVYVGPALAAAAEAAALEAPRLLLTGPDGHEEAAAEAKKGSIFLQAEEVRTFVGKQTLVLFVEGDRLRIFDRDARRAHEVDSSLPLVEIGDIAEIELPSTDAHGLASKLANHHEVAIASVKDGKIALEHFSGNAQVSEELDAAEAKDSVKLAERAKERADRRQMAWSDKPVSERYEDLLIAARSKEIPALRDGDRFYISGKTARDLSDQIDLLKERLDGDDLTWFTEDEAGVITGQLASEGKRLMLAEGLTRGTWRAGRISGAEQSQSVAEVESSDALALHAELSTKHPGRVLFVLDGDVYRTFGDQVEEIGKKDPLLTSKFEQVGEHKSIALSASEVDYQARQMSLRGLAVSIAKLSETGTVSLENFDPKAEIQTEADFGDAAAGQKREEAVKRETPASARLEAETQAAQEARTTDHVAVWDSAKQQSPQAVILINTGSDHVTYDSDARLAARFFTPAQNALCMVEDGQDRKRVATAIKPNVVERAIETLRHQSADVVVLNKEGDEWHATSHAATRASVDYESTDRAVLKRRSFDTDKTYYAPANRSGELAGQPLIDGVSLYTDEAAAATMTGSAVPVYLRASNLAKLTAAELNGYSWNSRLREMHERFKGYGFSSPDELKTVLLDGNLEGWWKNRMDELGIAGDPKDLQRTIFNELKRAGHDGVIMLDENGYDRRVIFDAGAVYPTRFATEQQTNAVRSGSPSPSSTNQFSSATNMRPGNLHPAASAEFVPNRATNRFTVQATPETRQDVKSLLDELSGHFNKSADLSSADRKRVVRENGFLNRPLDGRVSRYTEDVIALNFGYVLYPNTAGHWVYASTRDFIDALGPGGSLYGRWAPELGDQVADYAGVYLDQLDANFETDLAGLKDRVLDLVEQMNPAIETHFVDRLFADGRVDGETDRQPVLGLFFSDTDSMTVSTDLSRGNPVLTGAHELYHSIAPLLSEAEARSITARFGDEEKAAEAFARWLVGETGAPSLGPITNFVERVNGLLKGHGFRSWQDSFRLAQHGTVAERAKVLDIASNISLEAAVDLVETAGLSALASTVGQYGRRLESEEVPTEVVYRLMRLHLSDREIIQAAKQAGYHRVEDHAGISTVEATRRQSVSEALERHRRLTPVDVGTNDAGLVRQPRAATSPQMRTGGNRTAPNPAIARASASPHVIRFKTTEAAASNEIDGTNPNWSLKEKPLPSSSDDAEYLHREDTGDIANRGGQTMPLPNPVFPISARNENQPMPRGNLDSIPAQAFALYLRPEDLETLRSEGNWPLEKPLFYDQSNRIFYISKSHPDFEKMYERFGHDQARSQWQAAKTARDSAYLQHANRSVDHSERIYLYIPIDELRSARRAGAVHDSTENQYYVARNHKNAATLTRKYGPENVANKARVTAERDKLASNNLARIDAAHETARQVAQYSLGRETAQEVGGGLASDLGKSAVLGGSIAGGVELANQAGAKELLPTAEQVNGIFQRFGPNDWRQLADFSIEPNMMGSLWDRLGEATRSEIENFVRLQNEGIENVREFFDASVAYAKDAGNSVSDNIAALGDPATYEALAKAAGHFGESVQDAIAGQTFGVGAGSVDPGAFVSDESFARFSAKAGTEVTPTILEQAKAAFMAMGEKAQQALEPVSEAIGAKASAVLLTVGGVGGLTAVANVAAAGGGAAALYATGNYLSRRRERLKNWTSVAKDAPWMLGAKEFGQVAKRLYRVESLKTADGTIKTLKDKTTGEPVLSETLAPGQKLSSRRLVEAAHTAMVEGAVKSGFPVPAHVLKSVDTVRNRHLEQGYVKPKVTSTLVDAASARAQAWAKSVPTLRAQDTSAVAYKTYADQLRKSFPEPERQFATLLRTQQRLSQEKDPAQRDMLRNGTVLMSRFLEEQLDRSVDRTLKQGPALTQAPRGRRL